jgi:hypothetical protein
MTNGADEARHSMPNSLALWLLWVCRDLQVSDVLGRRLAAPLARPRLGPERTRARCLPKATPHPVSGGAALTALGASKRCRTGSRRYIFPRQIQGLVQLVK